MPDCTSIIRNDPIYADDRNAPISAVVPDGFVGVWSTDGDGTFDLSSLPSGPSGTPYISEAQIYYIPGDGDTEAAETGINLTITASKDGEPDQVATVNVRFVL